MHDDTHITIKFILITFDKRLKALSYHIALSLKK